MLDTGILVAALITTDTPPAQIYQAWRKKHFELITSEWQLDEFRRVTRYSKLRRFLKPAEAGHLVNSLRQQATVLAQLRGFTLDFAEGEIIFCYKSVAGLWITAENPL